MLKPFLSAGVKIETLDDDGRNGSNVLLHSIHDLCEGYVRGLGRSQEVTNELIGLCTYSDKQDCTLLFL